MFDLDKWQEIFNSLQRHKLRTLLTAFGVFWGIFMLVLLLGVGKGLEKGVYSQFSRSATNRFNMWGRKTRLPYKGLNPGRWIRLTREDIELIRQNIPEALYVNANVSLRGQYSISHKNKNGAFPVQGVFSEFLHVRYLDILQGRFLNVPDIEVRRKVAVIGRQVEKVLFGEEDPVGKYISIKGLVFQVIGVFDVTGFGNKERDTEQIFIPLTTLQQALNQGNSINSLNVVVDENVTVAEIEEKAKELLKRRHSVAPEDDRAIGSWNAGEEFGKLQQLFQGIRIFLWVVGIGTIIAGIIGVSNIMLIIVKERTREIGIRKALGATPFSIISLILQEAIFLTAISGYMGLVAGVGVLEGVSYLMDKFRLQSEFFSNPEIEFPIAITATIILVFTGTLAGFIPARSAVKVNPIEALRSE